MAGLVTPRPHVVLVCGSRDWTERATIREWIGKLPAGSIVVHGAARGADTMAGEEAAARGLEVRPYPADWNAHGKAAGPIRNRHMYNTERPDVVLAFTWTLSREDRPERPTGTGDMVLYALANGTRCTLIPPTRPDVQGLTTKPGAP